MIVQAVWPGASLQDMQDQVVNKIERKLQETPHLDYVKSFTRAGSAIITGQHQGRHQRAREVADAFYQVRKKTGDIANELPQGLLGPYFNDEFGDTFITLHAITGDGFSYPELKTFAKAGARPSAARQRRREGCRSSATRTRRLYIDVSSKVLAERGLSPHRHLAGDQRPEQCRRRRATSRPATRSVRVSVEGDLRKAADVGRSAASGPAGR